MKIIGKKLNVKEFLEHVNQLEFSRFFRPNKLVIHHTWRPKKHDWNGEKSILGLKAYYERKRWSAGPHLFIAEDGIWLFTPMNKVGIHAGSGNFRSIGIEVVGDYDARVWSGKTKNYALFAISILMSNLDINTEQIKFHSDYSGKSCPGYAITKEWLFKELYNYTNVSEEEIPNWIDHVSGASAESIWNEAKLKRFFSDTSKFNDKITKGELSFVLKRAGLL